MSATVLILVRHGATQANVCRPHRLQGLRPDSELIEQGRKQARALAIVLGDWPIVQIYSSPLRRALETARLIVGRRELPIVLEEGIIEADVGEWTDLTWPEIEQRWPKEYRAFHEDPERHGYFGGENLGQVWARALPAVERLVSQHVGEMLLVVSHGAVNRVLLAHWLGIPVRSARSLPQDNAALNIIEFSERSVKVRTMNSFPDAYLAGVLARRERPAACKHAG